MNIAAGKSRLTCGCQCGSVRYALHAMPEKPCICNCRMCQKQVGNFFGAYAGVDSKDFELTREALSFFQSSDIADRAFCEKCGTPLAYAYLDKSRISVTIGSLDEPARIQPVVQYGIEARIPWVAEIFEMPGTVYAAPAMRSAECIHYRQHPDHDTAVWLSRLTITR